MVDERPCCDCGDPVERALDQPEGSVLCARCVRLRAELPMQVALCPLHAGGFYYHPIADDEIKLDGLVPAHFYNVVRDYVRAAAGDEFVLMPVNTLNAMGEERERLARELDAAR